MKSSVWVVTAVVAGLVGFLVGYSASGYRDARLAQEAREKCPAAPSQSAAAGQPASGGYGQ